MSAPIDRRRFLQGAVALGAGWAILGRTSWADLPVAAGTWLAGDLHCHTIYSPDVLEAQSAVKRIAGNSPRSTEVRPGLSPAEQIAFAEARGLDFLAITDHNSTKGLRDPGYASARLTLVPGYEHSLPRDQGHVALLGVRRPVRDYADRADEARALKRHVERRGGIFIPTHPYGAKHPWRPRMAVRPHALETWNGSLDHARNLASLERWDTEWLTRSRVGAVGGSDHHWLERVMQNGVGQPTTWVRAKDRSWESIVKAIKRGRTSVSLAPPALGGTRLVLDASDGRGNRYHIGDTAPRRPLTLSISVAGTWDPKIPVRHIQVVVDGTRLAPQPIDGPGQIAMRVRPKLYVRAELLDDEPGTLAAFTSPIWIAR